MGVIFQKQPRYETVRQHIEAALTEEPPSTDEVRSARATELARAVTTATRNPVVVNWRAFAAAFSIFVALLGLSILLDWKDVVDDPGAYTGLAGTALGAVLGFLTGDAAATLAES